MAMFDFVPEDVIYEILLRLPAKSIGRSRCVSRAWLSSLSSHQFIKAHFDHHHDHENTLLAAAANCPPSILTFTPNKDGVVSRKVTCSLFPSHRSVNVEGTCHGLVLLAHGKTDRMVLWNPLTSEAMEVPKVPVFYSLDAQRRFEKVVCGWDPHTLEAVEVPRIRTFGKALYGFGCCQGDDHKILRIWTWKSPIANVYIVKLVDVYSVKLKTWRRVANPRYDDYKIYEKSSGVFVNGCLHWIAYDEWISGEGSPVIVAFDLGREVFDETPLPTDRLMYADGLLAVGGCLAFQSSPALSQVSFPLEVWVMKEYGAQESWTKLTISGPEGTLWRTLFRPVWLLREEEEIVLASCGQRFGRIYYMEQLFAYNVRNGVRRDMVVAGDPLESVDPKNPLISFKQSLWSLPR